MHSGNQSQEGALLASDQIHPEIPEKQSGTGKQGRLLFLALLENYCELYSSTDPEKRNEQEKLFVFLCSRLLQMGILAPSDLAPEEIPLRIAYRHAFNALVSQANTTAFPALPYSTPSLTCGESQRFENDFIVLTRIGSGAFGAVFAARHKVDGVEYAIKRIPFVRARHEEILREVYSLARLEHVNVVRYHSAWFQPAVPLVLDSQDSGETFTPSSEAEQQIDSLLYIQMQLCQSTLGTWIKKRNHTRTPVDPNVVCRIFVQIVRGLDYIHGHGLVHRDLNPKNVFFHNSADTIKIGDFGLVSPCSSGGSGAGEKTAVGTAGYIAPEVGVEGAGVSVKGDIYSLGVILFELCVPFATGSERAHLIHQLRNDHRLPEEFLKEMPAFAALVLWCTAREASRRPCAREILDLPLFDETVDEFEEMRRLLAEKDARIHELEMQLHNKNC